MPQKSRSVRFLLNAQYSYVGERVGEGGGQNNNNTYELNIYKHTFFYVLLKFTIL
jgi:hypothetical protein